MENPPFLQLFPKDAGQGAALGLGEVRHTELGGVQLIPRAHGGDEGDPGPLGLLGQKQLGTHRVDGVRHVVVLGEVHLPGVLRGEEQLPGLHLAGGVDLKHTLPGHLHLGAAHGALQGDDLPVDVGQGHGVAVEQIQGAHAAAGQGLHHIAPHAANAEHGHPGPLELFQPLGPDEQLLS